MTNEQALQEVINTQKALIESQKALIAELSLRPRTHYTPYYHQPYWHSPYSYAAGSGGATSGTVSFGAGLGGLAKGQA